MSELLSTTYKLFYFRISLSNVFASTLTTSLGATDLCYQLQITVCSNSHVGLYYSVYDRAQLVYIVLFTVQDERGTIRQTITSQLELYQILMTCVFKSPLSKILYDLHRS